MPNKKLNVGDKAPEFTGLDQNGTEVKLSDFQGRKLVLFFYPKDMTPGCTAEACNLRDNFSELRKAGYEVIGVSADSEKRHQKFIETHGLPYSLVADEEKEIIKKFGVWGRKKFLGREYDGIKRTTFVIDEKGMIEKVIDQVKTRDHTSQILD